MQWAIPTCPCEGIRPHTAILDSDLLTALPKSLIGDAGYDVLAHALEACAAKKAGKLSDTLAKEAFSVTFQNLPASFRGDQRVRLPIHQAAAMAGIAFSQAGLGLCHALSHSLGGQFHVPHGRLNAILLPCVVEINTPAVGHKYADFARAAGLGGTADTVALRNLRNGLIRLRKELLLPATLAQAGVSPQKVWAAENAITQAALADPCSATNPVPVTAEVVHRVLEEVTGNG